MLAVVVNDLSKIFGKVIALDGISFFIDEGEIYGLVGPNAAGKTTTLRIIATLLTPSSGSVNVFGYDVIKDSLKIREIISYLPEEAGAYKNLSGMEYLQFMANLYIKTKLEAEKMAKDAINISGLGNRLKDKVKEYSRGMLRRLLVARTLMVKPKLAILDEPTSGVDVIHSIYIRKVIKEYARKYKVTVLVSSHNMLEVEFLCDRMGLINKGKIVVEGTPKELKEKYGAENLEQVFMKAVKHA